MNYDNRNWKLLGRALETSPYSVPAVNRAQLLDDALALSFEGRLDFGVALAMTRFLLKEDDPVVWMSALRNLQDLYAYVSDDVVRLQLKVIIPKLLCNPLARFLPIDHQLYSN